MAKDLIDLNNEKGGSKEGVSTEMSEGPKCDINSINCHRTMQNADTHWKDLL